MADATSILLGLVGTLAAILVLGLVVRWYLWLRLDSLPPGPSILTTIAISMKASANKQTSTHAVFTELARKYGAIYSAHIGTSFLTVVNDYALAKEALVKTPEHFANRRSAAVMAKIFGHGGGVLHENGEPWKVRRKFGLNALRYFGVGKTSIESRINEEAECLVQNFAEHQGKAFDPSHVVMNAVSNIIACISFGRRFEYTDESFQRMIKVIQYIGASSILEVGNVFPFLVDTFLYKKKKLKFRSFRTFVEAQLQEHKDTLDTDNPRDLIDMYLVEVMKDSNNNKGEDSEALFTETNMWAFIQDLFLAGTETTSNSFLWILLFFVLQPDVQKNVQQEINDFIGPSRRPTLADMQSMPYTQAAILEAFRSRPVVTVYNRETPDDRDVTIAQYNIPRKSYLLMNVYAMHHDPKVFPEPEKYRPERFLSVDEQGKRVFTGKGQPLMTFGSGRRSCMGDAMAKSEIFVFLVNILQRFNLELKEGCKPDLEGLPGRMWAPSPFMMHAVER